MRDAVKCEACSNYVYDDEAGYYSCALTLDEDDMARAMQGTLSHCPYFQFNDDHTLSRKQ